MSKPGGKNQMKHHLYDTTEYLSTWWEVGARINVIRHAEKLGLNRVTSAQQELELIFPKKFIKNLKDNYWAFLPVGSGMWKDEGFWNERAEAEWATTPAPLHVRSKLHANTFF